MATKKPQPKQRELFDPQEKQRKAPVGVTLAPDDLHMLDVIQSRYGMNRSATIRACIHKVYSMTEE
jgi:hypothetical protein